MTFLKSISVKLAIVLITVGTFGTGVLLFDSAKLAISLHGDLDTIHNKIFGDIVNEEWAEASKLTAKILANDISLRISSLDTISTNEQIKTVLADSDVRYFVVLDLKGRVLSSGLESYEKIGTIVSDSLSIKAMAAPNSLVQVNGEIFDISAPIELEQTRIATLRIGFAPHRLTEKINFFHRQNDAHIKEAIWNKIYAMAFFGILSSTVFVGIALAFLRHMLVVPLRAISQASAKVRAGDLSHRIQTNQSGDELEQLSVAFNTTVEWLQNVLESIPDGVALWDSQNQLVVCNENYRRFNPLISKRLVFGVTLEDIVTAAVHEGQYVIDGPPEPWIAERLRRCREEHGEQEYILTDGRQLLVRHQPSKAGGVASITADITELKSAYTQVAESKLSIAAKILESTELELARREAEHAKEQFRLLLDSAGEGLYGVDIEGRCTFINRSCLNMFGYSSSVELLGLNLHGLTHHTRSDGSAYLWDECRIRGARQTGTGVTVSDEIFWRKDGSSFPAEYSAFPIMHDGQIMGTVVSIMDISERKTAIEALRRSELRLRSIVENAGDCILVHDFDGKITSANHRTCHELGYTHEELMPLSLADIDAKFDLDEYVRLWKFMTPGVPLVLTSTYQRKDGSQFPVEIHLGYYETGEQPLIVLLAHNITDRLHAEEQIKHLASHDTLTGLPNRALFLDRLSRALVASRRSGKHMAVLFLDLDGFKAVNDARGHTVGDVLLVMVSARLLSCVREMDTIARLGGDEFTIALPESDDPAGSIRVAEKILDALGQPFPIDGMDVSIGVSIGIAYYPGDGETSEQLMMAADTAMYMAKNNGKNRYILASPSQS